MSIVDYAYSNTRARVMKGLLLGEREIESLTRVKNLDDFVVSLKQTAYGDVLSGLEDLNVHKIDRALALNLVKAVNKVRVFSPRNAKAFMDAVTMKYEFEIIKLALNSHAGDLSVEEIEDKLPLSGKAGIFKKDKEEFLSRLSSMNLSDIVSALPEIYPGMDRYMSDSSSLVGVLAGLDKYYFYKLSKAVDSLEGADRKVACALVSLEVGAANIMIALRAVQGGYDPLDFLVPGKGCAMFSSGSFRADDVQSMLKKLSETAYGPALEDASASFAKNKSLFPVESALKKFIAKKSRAIMNEQPFSLGFLLGYLRMKELEVENLRGIAFSISEGMPSEKIEALLVI